MTLFRNVVLPTIVCLSFFFPAAGQTASPFAGMTGKEILECIRNSGRPENLVQSEDEIRKVISSYAYIPGAGYRDYFSTSAIGTLNTISIVPLIWWSDNSADYAAVCADLHNIVPANLDVAANRSDYPPGIVNEIIYSNDCWRAGIGDITGFETNFYEPADDLKGDFARIYMYMAAVYPQSLWNSRGAMLYIDGYYPILTAYGKQILLDWHRSDPVDEAELRRDAAIAAAQGCSNPFVRQPEIAEYIWGYHADEVFNDDEESTDPEKPDEPDQPDTPAVEPIMLKAVYSVAADRRIDFRSPYVAAGSVWRLDGAAVSSESVSLSDISLGRHEISYSNDRAKGKIIITVEP